MKRLFQFLFLILLLGCYDDSKGFQNPNDYFNTGIHWSKQGTNHIVLLLGDSRLDRMIDNHEWNELPWTVYNCAMSGTSTIGIISQLQYVDLLHPDIVILSVGVNDYYLDDINIEGFAKRLAYIVNYLEQRYIKIIIVNFPIATCYYIKFAIIMEMYLYIQLEYPQYFVPIKLNDEDRLADGLHENERGYQKVVRALIEAIGE